MAEPQSLDHLRERILEHGPPGTETRLKLEFLEGVRRIFQEDESPLPEWWDSVIADVWAGRL